MPKHIEVKEVGNVTVVACTDDRIVDELLIHEWSRELLQLVEEEGCTKMVINFLKVSFMGSAAIGFLNTLNKKLAEKDGKLALCCIIPQIWKAFEIIGFDKKFKMYTSEIDALREL